MKYCHEKKNISVTKYKDFLRTYRVAAQKWRLSPSRQKAWGLSCGVWPKLNCIKTIVLGAFLSLYRIELFSLGYFQYFTFLSTIRIVFGLDRVWYRGWSFLILLHPALWKWVWGHPEWRVGARDKPKTIGSKPMAVRKIGIEEKTFNSFFSVLSLLSLMPNRLLCLWNRLLILELG